MKTAEIKMAWRNLSGQKRRTSLTVCIMTVGLVALFFLGGWINFVKVGFRDTLISEQLSHFQIYPEGHSDLQDESQTQLLFSAEEVATIEDILYDEITGVNYVNPRINLSGTISGKNYAAPIFTGYAGEPGYETEMVPPTIVEGNFLDPQYTNPIVLGKGLAKALNVGLGDEVILTVAHSGNRIDANVATVSATADFEITELNNRMLITTLDTAANQLVDGAAQRLLVMLNSIDDLERVRSEFETKIAATGIKYEIKEWSQLADYYNKVIRLYNNQLFVLSFVILFMFSIVIANTIYMSIMERQNEIGTLRAIGISNREIINIVFFEGLFLGLIGLACGVIAGYVLQFLLAGPLPVYMPPPPGMTTRVSIQMLISFRLIVILGSLHLFITLAATIMPAFKAVRINIIRAIRQMA